MGRRKQLSSHSRRRGRYQLFGGVTENDFGVSADSEVKGSWESVLTLSLNVLVSLKLCEFKLIKSGCIFSRTLDDSLAFPKVP